jgi:hypothetical protein
MSTSILLSVPRIVSPLTRCHIIWQDVNTWLALTTPLFMSISRKVDPAPGPVIFRFTTMAEVLKWPQL